MSSRAPISFHLELHRYWEARRDGRAMPARRDFDPASLKALLPYLTLIEPADGGFRYRLVGTAVSEDLGRDLTGNLVGSYVNPPEYAAAQREIYERIFATGRPLFTTGEYLARSKAIHSVSRLMVPLSEDGTRVTMVAFTRIARFNHNVTAGIDWLRGAPGKVCETVDLSSVAEAESLCLAWERNCARAEVAA